MLEGLSADAPKTSTVAGVLKKMGVYGKRTRFVVDQQNDAVWKSVRNIDRLETTLAHQLNTYDLMKAEALILTADGLARVKEVQQMNKDAWTIVRAHHRRAPCCAKRRIRTLPRAMPTRSRSRRPSKPSST